MCFPFSFLGSYYITIKPKRYIPFSQGLLNSFGKALSTVRAIVKTFQRGDGQLILLGSWPGGFAEAVVIMARLARRLCRKGFDHGSCTQYLGFSGEP